MEFSPSADGVSQFLSRAALLIDPILAISSVPKANTFSETLLMASQDQHNGCAAKIRWYPEASPS